MVTNDLLKKHIEKIVRPIFERAAKETPTNPMMVGRVPPKNGIKFLIQPHNYRLYFKFKKINFNPPNKLTTKKWEKEGLKYSIKNHNSEHHFDSINKCRIIIKKNKAEVINKSHDKQWRLIFAESIDDIDKRIKEVTDKLDRDSIKALGELIREFGGKSDFQVVKRRAEYGIHGEDYLDRIPPEMVIQDTVFKKVYAEKVEFYRPTEIKNYISNRSLEEFAPEIAGSIADINRKFDQFINEFLPIHKEHAINIKTHTKVLKNIEKSFKRFNDMLSQKSLLKYL